MLPGYPNFKKKNHLQATKSYHHQRTIKINERSSTDVNEMGNSINNRMNTDSDTQGYTMKHLFHYKQNQNEQKYRYLF